MHIFAFTLSESKFLEILCLEIVSVQRHMIPLSWPLLFMEEVSFSLYRGIASGALRMQLHF